MRSLKGTTAFDKYGNRVLAAVRGNCRPAVFPSHGAKLFNSVGNVKLIFLQPGDALSAFANGQADCWVI